MDISIQKQWIRYIIPFAFECRDKDSFISQCEKINKRRGIDRQGQSYSIWERIKFPTHGETDIYEHIQRMADTESQNEAIWISSDKSGRKTFFFQEAGADQIKVQKLGLQIFSSGIGFLWLDISLNSKDGSTLCTLNNQAKEIAYRIPFYEKCGKEEYKSSDFGQYILSYLQDICITSYFVERRVEIDGRRVTYPDKFTIFSWFLGSGDWNELQQFNRLFAHGYSLKYNLEENKEELHPFQNFTWAAAKEGLSGVTCIDEINQKKSSFFLNGFEGRLESYFQIYLLALHEYYYNLAFSAEIAKLVNQQNKKHRLTELQALEDRFLSAQMKTVYLQVSHISHQNRYYHYLREVLEAETFGEELNRKITAIKNSRQLQEEVRTQKRIQYFTWLSALFVLIQTYNNVVGLVPFFTDGVQRESIVSGIILLIIAAVCLIVWAGYNLWNRKR